LVREAVRGAESAGTEAEIINLYDMEPFTGCISCFGCKSAEHLGHCVRKDSLTPLLEKIRGADGLVLGSPIYLNDVTASIGALVERLCFQYTTYKREYPSYNKRQIPVIGIITCGCPEHVFDKMGYSQFFAGFFQTLSRIGPVETLVSDDSWQVNDYEKRDWTLFNTAKKQAHKSEVFPRDMELAYSLGAGMFQGNNICKSSVAK
jgi:multimeric flavodoxin WrbA